MFKRGIDVSISLLAITLLSPIMVVISALILFKMGSPILFKQSRPGLNEKHFKVYKFRTMKHMDDVKGIALSDEERVTTLGLMLRRSSLDELPQLINILKGEMSIVGPRPLLIDYSPFLTAWERRRHEVKPGLTGLAQINGRQDISWEDKLRLDVEYVDSQSLLLDMKIMIATLMLVIKREGILYAAPQGRLDEYRRALNLEKKSN